MLCHHSPTAQHCTNKQAAAKIVRAKRSLLPSQPSLWTVDGGVRCFPCFAGSLPEKGSWDPCTTRRSHSSSARTCAYSIWSAPKCAPGMQEWPCARTWGKVWKCRSCVRCLGEGTSRTLLPLLHNYWRARVKRRTTLKRTCPTGYSVQIWLNCGSCAHTFCSCPLMRCAAACREKEVAYCKDSPWHVQTQSRGSQLGSGWREGEKGCALPVASARTLLGGDGDALVRRGASVVHSPARRSARRGAKGRREFDQARCTLSYLFNTA